MRLIATALISGEPVARAYGCVAEGRGLRAGMLFVKAGLKTRRVEFEEPTTKRKMALLLPETALALGSNGRAYNVFLNLPETT